MTAVLSSRIGRAPAGLDRPAAGTPYRSVNPSDTADVVAELTLATAEVFRDAAAATKAAQPAWAAVPAPVRGRVIAMAGRLIESNAEELARLITREIGKPIAEARGEVQEAVDTCDFFLGEGRRLYGRTVPSELVDKHLFTVRKPVGSVAVITAGNFPVAVPSWYIVPALLCGNAVLWKPAEYATAVATAFHDILLHAGVPADALNLVVADGPTTFDGLARALDEHLVDKVGFTGSTAVGERIGALCGQHLQAPCLELGGKNPMVVTPSADLDLAVEGALFSGFGTAGQRCTSLGTAIVHESVHAAFLDRFTAAVRAVPIGDPDDPGVFYGPMLTHHFLEGLERHLDLVAGHHRVSGSDGLGRITAANPRAGFVGDPEKGWFCHPTIVDGVRPEDELFVTETFGPLVGVTTYRHFDEAVELANRSRYGLSAAIYTTDPREAFGFHRGVDAGMISICNSTSGAEAHLPFGGNGRSGNGSRQSGTWVLDQFTHWQSVNWDYSATLQKAQMDVHVLPADLDFRIGRP